ncbi:ABC transporter substrate-binding protein [Candidatus Electrothrix laxa]
MRSFMKLFPQCFFIVLFLFFYVGCHQAPPTALRIGTNIWPGYEPLYLAKAQGYYKDLNVRLVEYPSASEVLRAFKNGNLEAVTLTLDEVVYLCRSNPDIKIALVMDVSHGGDVIIAKEGIESVEDLRGKRVAVESNALGAYFTSRALEMHGMRPEDVSVVHTEVSGHEEAFLQNRVDAAVTFEPVRTKLLAAGGKEIFSSREIPGEIVDVLVVDEKAMMGHRDIFKKVIKGWFRALDDLEKKPQEAAGIMAKRLKITPDEVLASYDGLILPDVDENHRMLNEREGTLYRSLGNLSGIMMKHNLLEGEPSYQHLLTEQFLP